MVGCNRIKTFDSMPNRPLPVFTGTFGCGLADF